ncbi:MAG: T9SS type A sorting domain-containing protein [Sphingobacteriales bacterium]|nr:MAG: T9SS type A sorting domain-containing protein [Sphingobacteriales bacterium]
MTALTVLPIFFSTAAKWQVSQQKFIPMIRPYFSSNPVVGIKQKTVVSTFDVSVYPNPNNGNFNINIPKTGSYEINVFDLAGKPVMQPISTTQENILLGLPGVKAGLYFLRIADKNSGQSVVKRISVL